MLIEDLKTLLPQDWYPMDIYNCSYQIFELHEFNQEYWEVAHKTLQSDYYNYIYGIYKIQNPRLYANYMIKKREYEQRGPCNVLHLFHDTASRNIESIAAYNIDWRHGMRCKFGPGVYFSISPTLANKHSLRGSSMRAMFLCNVLVQNVQEVNGQIFLPDFGYDTVLGHNNFTYVKYFDCEYYPTYFVSYYAKGL